MTKVRSAFFLVCVSDQLKAYKLHHPITKKIIINWDVVFDEETFGPWSNNEIEKDYEVKQESRAWYNSIDAYFVNEGFQ